MLKYEYINIIVRGDFMEVRKNNLLVSEILSKAFSLCKDNFLEILKAIGIFMAPALIIPLILFYTIFATALLGSSIMYSYPYPNSFLDNMFAGIGAGTIAVITLLSIILGLLSFFGSLVITKILDDANKGNEVSWKSAARYVWDRKWRALGLNIIVWLMLVIGIIAIMILFGILTVLTLGIGLIIFIPLYLAIIFFLIPVTSLFNSTFLVNDLGAIDSLRETFLLFRKGYFWSTIGRLAAIAGIYIGVIIILAIFDFIPFIGVILMVVGQCVFTIYMSAYLNVFVFDRNRPNIDNFEENNDSGDSFIDPII